jgi:hypothetical protein
MFRVDEFRKRFEQLQQLLRDDPPEAPWHACVDERRVIIEHSAHSVTMLVRPSAHLFRPNRRAA